MVYGVNASVEIWIGGFTGYITTGKVDSTIVLADAIVDNINSSASDADKTTASNMITMDILLNGQDNKDSRGSTQMGGTQGQPSITAKIRPIPSKEAIAILRSGVGSRNDTQLGT